ncbi:hypothetical protein ATANTOWER_022151 [Ataeniobius toweri]|uniref:Uncharacterized protein n=1 Tax=Ataeniobius toweri TaxID=208326 RepID=A0ABU7AZ31_9TELE|nr:hypothetical protein [Ataeniobius toweri]
MTEWRSWSSTALSQSGSVRLLGRPSVLLSVFILPSMDQPRHGFLIIVFLLQISRFLSIYISGDSGTQRM